MTLGNGTQNGQLRYKRILLKLSGEALQGSAAYGIDFTTVESIAATKIETISAASTRTSAGVHGTRVTVCSELTVLSYGRLSRQRFEARDTQFLLGTLVDQGIARADGLAATGISYGGGQSMELAYLNDRTRMPDDMLAANGPQPVVGTRSTSTWLPSRRTASTTPMSTMLMSRSAQQGSCTSRSASISSAVMAPPGSG